MFSETEGGLDMNLGIRAHDIEADNLENLVQSVTQKGLSSVQLALSKSFDFVPAKRGYLSPGLAGHIGSAFRKQDIQIAVLGCYINMIHPDPAARREALDRFKEYIRFARDFGCSIVGTETGNVHASMGYTEDNFHEAPFQSVVESVRELVKEAEKFGVIVGIEGGVNHPVYSPKLMRKLLDLIDSNHLQVIYDPVNYLTLDNYQDQDAMIEEAMDLFGDRIVILHAKDFKVEENSLITTAVGQGLLNYDLIMKLIKARKPYIHMLMESTVEPHIDSSISFLKEKYHLNKE
jgi:L-ribulose-5-phosphate 3-epimerase